MTLGQDLQLAADLVLRRIIKLEGIIALQFSGQKILRRYVVQRVDFAEDIAAHFEVQMRSGRITG